MDRKIVTPLNGLAVVDPDTNRPLPAEGAEVVWSTYWQRRLNDGDISVKEAPKSKTK